MRRGGAGCHEAGQATFVIGYTVCMSSWASQLRCIGLGLLVAAPLVFVAVLAEFKTGRNLNPLFLAGSGLFFVAAVWLIWFGTSRRRIECRWGGFATLLSVLVSLLVAGNTARWIGSKEIVLTVVVSNAENGQPVPNASVCIAHYERSEGTTDLAGTVAVEHTFTTVGDSSSICQVGTVYLFGETLEVNVDGYQPLQQPLDDYTGSFWPLYGPPLPQVKVELKKKRN